MMNTQFLGKFDEWTVFRNVDEYSALTRVRWYELDELAVLNWIFEGLTITMNAVLTSMSWIKNCAKT